MEKMRYICILMVIIFFCSCVKKPNNATLSQNNVGITASNIPESIEESTDNEASNVRTKNHYTFELSNDGTYWHMNDISYFLADKTVKSLRFWRGTFSDLSPLSELQNLEELSIIGNEYINDISPIGSLVKLKKLIIFNVINIENIDALSLLINLEYLELNYRDKYYKELQPLQRLEVLKITNGIHQELDVTCIATLHSLKELYILVQSKENTNIEKLKYLLNLERLTIDNFGVIDISWLSNLQKLTNLELRRCTVDDISPMLELPNLNEVNLHYSVIRDITPLLKSKSIKIINGPIVLENNENLYHLFRERGIEYYPHTSDR